ncbi:TonB-dependent receptor plug domain-containing protein [Sphingomonas morindae]|uniref:TonB-dependent receptor n=1 Tax=Sphingomonas morindae TaxID=1541170 RepID=A0ABY4X8D2_9SPHN|nr:TonB-dependent receptor [Sphingomonas morindae]USI73143.1 TonB-dependent receptor [Sphingomonas morindae]
MTNVPSLVRIALVVALASSTAAFGQSPPGAAPEAPGGVDEQSDIIVTGTRASGITVAESAAPIKLVGADAISHVGQPNLNQVLTQLVPSFTAQGFGGDTANLTLSASLRGLNPNETLVLVNGKRRHGTSNLQVLASAFQGGAAPDLDYITPNAIDHIEVLEDGAAAQYGSDAIAGVINILLKHKDGGTFTATGGQYYKGDGETYSTSLNYGWSNDRGFVNFTGFYRYHNFSNRGQYDTRVYDPATGDVPATVNPTLAAAYRAMPGWPNINYIVGDARSKFGVGSYNAGYDLADSVQFYTFGTIGFRKAESYENVRLPDRVVGSSTIDPATGLFVAGTYGAPDALVPRPQGFEPQEAVRELDYQFTGGLKGDLAGFHWDLSGSYGADRAKIKTLNSINKSLYVDTHNDQSDFYDGFYRAAETVFNLDVSREIGSIATLAAGGEYRNNSYTIGGGEPNSYYGTGAQSFPGFNPLAAGRHARHNYAIYGDVALTPVEGLKLDGAVRYEDYSDFGHKTTWKATGRYDFTPAIAVRGTASTGFRAPTLAEEWYTAVNVSPTSATAQLAANSAAAKVLGIQNLKPETSRNYSAGLVLRPTSRLTVTIDAYQIRIRNRIVGSGSLAADTSNANDPVTRAIAAAGVVLEPGLPSFVSAFVNGPTTRTRGIDLVASYNADFDRFGKAVFTLSGAYNKTRITRAGAGTAIVPADELFNPQTYSFLTTTLPRWKVIGGVNWSLGAFNLVARETYYSQSVALLYNDNDPLAATSYAYSRVKPAALTDLELDYHLTERITLAVGANNLFDKQPEKVRFDQDGVLSGDTLVGGAPYTHGPYGINGGYYYGRIDVKF